MLLLPSGALSLFLPQVGVSVRFEYRVMWGEEMDLIPWAFPLVFLSLVYRMNREKRSEAVRRKLCCSAFVFYTAFPKDCVSEEGRGVQGGASLLLDVAWHQFGQMCTSWNQEVSWSPPSGFTVCLQAVALAAMAPSLRHHYVSKETIHTQKNLSSSSCLLLSTKKATKFQIKWKFCVSGIQEEQLKEFFFSCSCCSLWFGSVYTSSSCPLPVSVLTLWEGYWI